MSRHHAAIKNDPAWHAVRLACFERDDYACVDCGVTAAELEELEAPSWDRLQPDHLEELSVAPELALELDNLATRCGPCNRRRHHAGAGGEARVHYLAPAYRHALASLEATA